jgi:hypothetical protein
MKNTTIKLLIMVLIVGITTPVQVLGRTVGAGQVTEIVKRTNKKIYGVVPAIRCIPEAEFPTVEIPTVEIPQVEIPAVETPQVDTPSPVQVADVISTNAIMLKQGFINDPARFDRKVTVENRQCRWKAPELNSSS